MKIFIKKFMKKLKKSSNKKPALVFIYGPIAAGKYTIAEELSKRTGYKNFHNHLIIDLCLNLFGKKDERRSIFRQSLHFQIVKLLTKQKVSTIFTHAYASNFTFKTGKSDPQYVKETERMVTTNGGLFYGVQLICDDKVLINRLKDKSRKKFAKLKDVKTMKELLRKYDHINPAPIKNNLVIDNTNKSPRKVVDIIIKHYKL